MDFHALGYNKYLIGNFVEDSLDKVLNNYTYTDERLQMYRNLKGVCSYMRCGGSCQTNTFATYGDIICKPSKWTRTFL